MVNLRSEALRFEKSEGGREVIQGQGISLSSGSSGGSCLREPLRSSGECCKWDLCMGACTTYVWEGWFNNYIYELVE
jgi:hypothetical protein